MRKLPGRWRPIEPFLGDVPELRRFLFFLILGYEAIFRMKKSAILFLMFAILALAMPTAGRPTKAVSKPELQGKLPTLVQVHGLEEHVQNWLR